MAEVNYKNSIHFRFLPNMDIGTRFILISGLIVTGFVIQLVFGALFGWPLVFLAALLGSVRGLSTEPKLAGIQEWQTTTIDELESVEELSRKTKEWHGPSDIFRPTSAAGCGMLILALIVLVISSSIIWFTVDLPSTRSAVMRRMVTPIWILDFVTMMLPIWFIGWIHLWEPTELSRKASYLLGIYRTFSTDPNLEFVPSLLVTKQEDRSVPHDCRLLVKIRTAPAEFIGIQVQVSMNKVQGSLYPYCYSVIIAKPEFGLKPRAEKHLSLPELGGLAGLGALFADANARKEMAFLRFRKSLVEFTSEADVDVIVVRQNTHGKGYHTSKEQAFQVFNDALDLTMLILKSSE
ncbi:MAG: hypothetical protein K6U00_00715 [Armatimonadetes bacterium]|nr:hypothetical protein [Armatimonadota bacterium]